MKKLLILLLLCPVLHQALAVPSFDPFADATANGGTSYNVGDNLIGQTNSTLASAWYARGANSGSSIQPTIAAGNLGYTNLPPSTGNSVSFVPANAMTACLDLNLPISHTNTVYYSFLLKVTDLSAVSTAAVNNPIVLFLDDPAPQGGQIARRGARLLTKKVGSGYVLGTSKTDTTTEFVYEPDVAAHAIGEVVFVVGSYQRVGTVTNVFLWVNPPPASFGSNNPPAATIVVPAPTAGTTGSLNNNNARAFGIMCQFTGAPSGIIDDLRLSTNWVDVTGGDPAIVQNPANAVSPPGGSASFTVTARGTPTLAYQWIKDGTLLSDGGNLTGTHTASLAISNISVGDVGTYTVVVTNGTGSFVTSRSATLNLSNPAIIGQPQSRTNNFGTTATFQVTASGTAPFTYQWHKAGTGDLTDGGNISGSHSNVLTLTGVNFGDSGSYSVTVSNALGSTADSATAALVVRDPVILTQPLSITNLAGTTATFTITANGTPPLTYQWKKNGTAIFDGGNLSGTATNTLTISNVSADDAAAYSVVVTGGFSSSDTSTVAALTVLSPPSITIQPSSRAVTAGNRAVFAVGATGSAPLTYQWQRAGTNIPGATSSFYSVTNAQATDADSYSVVVSNFLNTVTSSIVTLTVSTNIVLYHNNFMVIRVGDGAQALSLNGNSMYLDQFTTSGSYLNTFCIPETGPSAIVAIGMPNVQGTTGNITGSGLTRSQDGRQLVVAGYNTNLSFGSSLAAATSSAVARGVGVVNSQGQYTLALSSTATIFSQAAFRASVTDGTNNFWGCGNKGGVYYFGLDDPEGPVASLVLNIRSFAVFNSSIYYASAVDSTGPGIYKLDGMPRSGAPSTLVVPGTTSTADMEVSPNGNIIYMANDNSAAFGGGIQRYEFDGSNWNLAYILNSGLPSGARYIGADFTGPNPILSAVTPESENNRLVRIVDTGVSSVGLTVASAGVNQVFRSTRFGPIGSEFAQSPVLSLTRDGNNIILSWNGTFTLQSATNVAGAYSNVSGATSPYTNNFNSASQQYFRLKN